MTLNPGSSIIPTAIRIGDRDRDRDSAARHLGVALAAGYLDMAVLHPRRD
ncbi:hypothetical protein BH09ACT8_BH09ACT8_41660 [soil metagenome]